MSGALLRPGMPGRLRAPPKPLWTEASLQNWANSAPSAAARQGRAVAVATMLEQGAVRKDGTVCFGAEGLALNDCPGLDCLPDGLHIAGNLEIAQCADLQRLGARLWVGGTLDIDACASLTTLPSDLYVGLCVYLSDCTSFKTLPPTCLQWTEKERWWKRRPATHVFFLRRSDITPQERNRLEAQRLAHGGNVDLVFLRAGLCDVTACGVQTFDDLPRAWRFWCPAGNMTRQGESLRGQTQQDLTSFLGVLAARMDRLAECEQKVLRQRVQALGDRIDALAVAAHEVVAGILERASSVFDDRTVDKLKKLEDAAEHPAERPCDAQLRSLVALERLYELVSTPRDPATADHRASTCVLTQQPWDDLLDPVTLRNQPNFVAELADLFKQWHETGCHPVWREPFDLRDLRRIAAAHAGSGSGPVSFKAG